MWVIVSIYILSVANTATAEPQDRIMQQVGYGDLSFMSVANTASAEPLDRNMQHVGYGYFSIM